MKKFLVFLVVLVLVVGSAGFCIYATISFSGTVTLDQKSELAEAVADYVKEDSGKTLKNVKIVKTKADSATDGKFAWVLYQNPEGVGVAVLESSGIFKGHYKVKNSSFADNPAGQPVLLAATVDRQSAAVMGGVDMKDRNYKADGGKGMTLTGRPDSQGRLLVGKVSE